MLARLMASSTVTVEPYTGTNGRGQATFGPKVEVAGYLDGARRMVRSSDGEETISSSTLYTALENAALFPLESRVTSGAIVAHVLQVNPFDTAGVIAHVEHLAVNLT
jgi:hypothetical protein